MNLASELLVRGASASSARGGMCMWCNGTGMSTVGYAGLERIGNGVWACCCEKGKGVLADALLRVRQESAGATLAQAQIPRHYADYTLESFRQVAGKSVEKVKALRMVNEWIGGLTAEKEEARGKRQERKPWLFLYGRTGRGKTGLGVGALKVLLGQGRVGRFVASFDMFAEMKARFGGSVEAYTDALASVDVLMLDEVVPVQITDWRVGVLFELLWRRDAAQATTIITTAAGAETLIQAVTEAGHRRIKENSLLVELGGNEINYGR